MRFDAFRGRRLAQRCMSASAMLLPGTLAVAAMLLSAPALRAGAPEKSTAALLAAVGTGSVDAIQRVVSEAVSGGFGAIVVPADLYRSPAAQGLDPLDEIVRQAHAQGLPVHAAIELKAVTAADEFPPSRAHVVYQHPEWLMVPRAIAVPLLAVDPHAPNYFGEIARWTRANSTRLPAVSLSPLTPDARSFIAAAVKNFVTRYAVDGLALDALSYQGDDFDYSRRATDLFRASMRATLDAAALERMNAIEAIDPFAYANEYPAEWRRFRMDSLTELVAAVRRSVEAARPGTMVSAALTGADTALDEYAEEWMGNRLVDAVTRRAAEPGTVMFAPLAR